MSKLPGPEHLAHDRRGTNADIIILRDEPEEEEDEDEDNDENDDEESEEEGDEGYSERARHRNASCCPTLSTF